MWRYEFYLQVLVIHECANYHEEDNLLLLDVKLHCMNAGDDNA